MRRVFFTLFALVTIGDWSVAFAQNTDVSQADRAITQLRGDLYGVRDGQQYTVFLVTPDGIILGDPLTRSTALWLRGELDARFPGRPVRFVLLSHHHVERSEGASVFTGTAELVGHRRFSSELAASRRRMSDAYRFVVDPESTYESQRTISLGGKTVEMIATGPSHSADMTLLFFRDERAVFAVNPPQVSHAPFTFGPDRPKDVFQWIGRVAPLDFEILISGAGEMVTARELRALSEYLETLRTSVAAGYEQGLTVAQIQASSAMDAYRSSPHYAAHAVQTAVVYRTLRLIRTEVSGFAIASNSARNPPEYCSTYASCAAGGTVPAGTMSTALLFGTSYGVVFELTFGAQTWSARTRPSARLGSNFGSYAEEVALRKSRGAVLFRYSPTGPGAYSMALVGGLSQTVGDVRGMDHVTGVIVPVGGRHSIAAHDSRGGVTFGIDLSRRVGTGVQILVPIRATQLVGTVPEYWPGAWDMQVGVGVAVQVFRWMD